MQEERPDPFCDTHKNWDFPKFLEAKVCKQVCTAMHPVSKQKLRFLLQRFRIVEYCEPKLM